MKQKNNSKTYGVILPMFLLAALMLITPSCDTVADEVCEEVEELCEETVTVCSNTSEEYYIFDGDTIVCAAIEDCEKATLEIVTHCTAVASAKEDDIKIRLQAILTNVRSLNY